MFICTKTSFYIDVVQLLDYSIIRLGSHSDNALMCKQHPSFFFPFAWSNLSNPAQDTCVYVFSPPSCPLSQHRAVLFTQSPCKEQGVDEDGVCGKRCSSLSLGLLSSLPQFCRGVSSRNQITQRERNHGLWAGSRGKDLCELLSIIRSCSSLRNGGIKEGRETTIFTHDL